MSSVDTPRAQALRFTPPTAFACGIVFTLVACTALWNLPERVIDQAVRWIGERRD